MAKISLNISEELNNIIREYAEKNELNLTNACTELFKKGLEKGDPEALEELKKEKEQLEKDLNEIKEELKLTKEQQLKDYKDIISQNTLTNQKLLDLMQADKIIAIAPMKKQQEEQEQKKEKIGFFKKVKMLFSSENNYDEN